MLGSTSYGEIGPLPERENEGEGKDFWLYSGSPPWSWQGPTVFSSFLAGREDQVYRNAPISVVDRILPYSSIVEGMELVSPGCHLVRGARSSTSAICTKTRVFSPSF